MAEYVLLIIGDDDAYQALDEAGAKAVMGAHEEFMRALGEAGVSVTGGAELAPQARTVRPDGTVTDGPFAEAKEQVGGFYSLDVPTFEEAVEWAKKVPMLPGDAIEVRPAR
jgi:hypothetical protein